MRAVLFESFGEAPDVVSVEDPVPPADGVVVKVEETGVCRSDWHGWMGHDPDIGLPHVPGQELAGIVEPVGKDVTRWTVGDRVTVRSWAAAGRARNAVPGSSRSAGTSPSPVSRIGARLPNTSPSIMPM